PSKVRLWVLTFALFAETGCSTIAGRPFGTQPSRSPMLSSATDLGQGPSGVLPLARELDLHPLPPYVVEPGDVLLVVASDLESPVRLPGDQPVFPDGTI